MREKKREGCERWGEAGAIGTSERTLRKGLQCAWV